MAVTSWRLMSRADCVGAGLQVKALASEQGWPERQVGELALLAIELTNNAVRHAGTGRCALTLDGEHFLLRVEDDGPGFPSWVIERHARGESIEAGNSAEPLSRRPGLGAGLDAAKRFADQLTLENSPTGGARVTASRRRKGP